jgi:hypothetical protein
MKPHPLFASVVEAAKQQKLAEGQAAVRVAREA